MAIIVLALVAGLFALQLMPREEEPQIVVPMVDVLVEAPSLTARQVERQVTTPLEKLLTQIPGVEHVYSSSMTERATVTLSFYVGENREDAILNTYNKLQSAQDKIPPVVGNWVMRPVEVDDVPMMVLSLWSDDPTRYSDYELRRLADEVSTYLQGIAQTSEVRVVGGRPRTVRVLLDPASMAARQTTASDIVTALQISNQLKNHGHVTLRDDVIDLESGDVFRSIQELKNAVVSVIDGVPVYLQDVARIVDGPAEAENYTWIDFAPGHPAYSPGQQGHPMVAISIAKQRGSNAVAVAEDVHEWIALLEEKVLPAEIHIEVIRDYGQTAQDKANYLISSLAVAVTTVVIFIGIFLGWRQALVVGLAMPICYAVTLAMDFAFGYTINRVTMAALIVSLGLLVDDPITGVDNISRFIAQKKGSVEDRIVAAMAEIRLPLLMSTLTIVLAFMPLAFITGMAGPYLSPMAFNVPVSVITSTVVAFLVTPWLASRLLKPASRDQEEAGGGAMLRLYSRLLTPLLVDRRKAKMMLCLIVGLLLLVSLLPALRMVPFKLLPFDNKNELQIVVDMPESSSLERTAALVKDIASEVSRVTEVRAIAAWVGLPSPIDFNGMARRYYQRVGPHLADLRLTLVDKQDRTQQSHGVVLRLRQLLAPLSRDGVVIKVVEVPPGPPVMSTLVAELYGTTLTPYAEQERAAGILMERLRREPLVVEVDSSVEADRSRWRFVTDKPKAALSGIATEDVNQALGLASHGYVAGFLHADRESRPLPIELRLAPEDRGASDAFARLQIKGRPNIVRQRSAQGLESAPQPLVALGELGQFETSIADKTIHHKDLRPVVYVMAEVSGRTPAEVIADLQADRGAPVSGAGSDWRDRSFLNNGGGDGWDLPNGLELTWSGEGEWLITVNLFRDMGIGYGFALLGIFFVLRLQTTSTVLSLIIMSAIPLTVIGILPGFWLLNQVGDRVVGGAPDPVLFTATAMVGMIALAGIVVRNSLILVEFITEARARGAPIRDALIEAGAVRARPVLLTAGTTLLGNLVITLDPVFSGLALAVIFGMVASTLFTLFVVPVVYLLVFEHRDVDKYSASEGQV
jgi:multidrug efflux pump subunit AcrB